MKARPASLVAPAFLVEDIGERMERGGDLHVRCDDDFTQRADVKGAQSTTYRSPDQPAPPDGSARTRPSLGRGLSQTQLELEPTCSRSKTKQTEKINAGDKCTAYCCVHTHINLRVSLLRFSQERIAA